MVQQCGDCKLWFRTEEKFRNHKEGNLGLSCTTVTMNADKSKEEPKKIDDVTGNDIIDSFEISDDEEEIDNKNVNKATKIGEDDYVDEIISDDEEDDEDDVIVSSTNATEKLTIKDQPKPVAHQEVISDDDEDEEGEESRKYISKPGVENKMVPDEVISDDDDMEDDSPCKAQDNETTNDDSPRKKPDNETTIDDSHCKTQDNESTRDNSPFKTQKETIRGKPETITAPQSVELINNEISNTESERVEASTRLSADVIGKDSSEDETTESKIIKNAQEEEGCNTSKSSNNDVVVGNDKATEEMKESKIIEKIPESNENHQQDLLSQVIEQTFTETTLEEIPKLVPQVESSTAEMPKLLLEMDEAQKPMEICSKPPAETEVVPTNTGSEVQINTITSSSNTIEEVPQDKDKDNDNSILLSDDEHSDSEEFLDNDKKSKTSNTDATTGTNDKFTLISVHLDTFKASNEKKFTISQIGCSTSLTGDKEDTFFAPIKPANLENYLENYKMEGDLLKALHITESDNGKFEFRAQFEIKRKEKNKIYCSSEEEALENIKIFLRKHSNVILFAIDKETIECFTTKIQFKPGADIDIAGFLTWSDVLTFSCKYLSNNQFDPTADLEDFYSDHCGKVSGYINALDVANFLRKSVKKLFNEYAKKLSQNDESVKFSWHEIFKDVVKAANEIGEATVGGSDDGGDNLSVEVYSSFRPSVSTKISLEKMETLQLSSGGEKSDSDIDIMEEKIVAKPKKKQSQDMLRQKLRGATVSRDILRQKLQQQFESLRSKKTDYYSALLSNRNVRQEPTKRPRVGLVGQAKRPRVAEEPKINAPIVITSSEDEDDSTDEESIDHEKVAYNLRKRKVNITPVMTTPPVVRTPPMMTPPVEQNNFPPSNTKYVPHCAICNVEFGSIDGLRIHVDRIHLRCNICNIQFNILALAIAHNKIHEGDANPLEPFVVVEEQLLQEEKDVAMS